MSRQVFLWIVFSSLVLSGCGVVIRAVTEEPRPFFHVGSVTFGEARQVGTEIHVPVTLGKGPWQGNSGEFPTRIITRVEGRQIEMTIHFSGSLDHVEKGRRLVLPSGLDGIYEVLYRDPDGIRHPVGKLNLNGSGDS